jgi:hypothetical protein
MVDTAHDLVMMMGWHSLRMMQTMRHLGHTSVQGNSHYWHMLDGESAIVVGCELARDYARACMGDKDAIARLEVVADELIGVPW